MASYNDYKEYKNKKIQTLVLIKSGVFYETYNDDCKIMLDLFNYQIKNFKSFSRTGFPVNNIEKVREKLDEKEIDYMIVENANVINIEHENNRYNFYVNKRVDKMIEEGLVEEVETIVDKYKEFPTAMQGLRI